MRYSETTLNGHDLAGFHPGYGHLSSVIGNYAAILTAGDHYEALFGDGPAEFVHRRSRRLRGYEPGLKPAALSIPPRLRGILEHTGRIHVENAQLLSRTDGEVAELVHKHEPGLYVWALNNPCGLLYSDEFSCGRELFLGYCDFAHRFLGKLRLPELVLAARALRAATSLYLAREAGLEFVGAYVCEEVAALPARRYYSTAVPRQTSALLGL